MRHILSIAGSDSCAGAGIQADIKTISALGSYGLTAITAVTAQNTRGVLAWQEIKAEIVRVQLEALFADIRVDAVKIGMLGSTRVIETISDFFTSLFAQKIFAKRHNYSKLPLVIDPVMYAKSGDRLLEEGTIDVLRNKLLPLATVITPNLPEAEELLGKKIKNIADMEEAGRELLSLGTPWVVVKGGHLEGDPVDVVGHEDSTYLIEGRRVETSNNHGTGCTFSSAIATYLGQGYDMLTAIKKARLYVETTLQGGFAIGEGVGILKHL